MNNRNIYTSGLYSEFILKTESIVESQIIISKKRVFDWNCEETCDWFERYGFAEQGVLESIRQFGGTTMQYILKENVTSAELGIIDPLGVIMYQQRVEELKLRCIEEENIFSMDAKQLQLISQIKPGILCVPKKTTL